MALDLLNSGMVFLYPFLERAIELVKQGVSYEDEELRRNSKRWLYISGDPGSGKSAVVMPACCQVDIDGVKV